MLTFNSLYNRVTSMVNDTSAGTVTLAKALINEAYKEALDKASINDNGEFYISTSSDKYIYTLPADLRKIKSVIVIEADTTGTCTGTTANKLVNSGAAFTASLIDKIVYNTTDNTFTRITAVDSATQLSLQDDIMANTETYIIGDGNHYIGKEVVSEDEWNMLQESATDVSSDVLSEFYIRGNNIELYPIPDTTNILYITYTKLIGDMVNDDYTTGTVTVSKGSTTVTGSGTTFTTAMIGRYFRGATTGNWYRIKSFTSTTVITLETPFNEISLSGSTYTIGELPLIPELFQPMLTYKAIAFLYLKREELTLASKFEQLYEKEMQRLEKWGSSKSNKLVFPLSFKDVITVDYSKDKLVTIS